jgi:hypothetical protein
VTSEAISAGSTRLPSSESHATEVAVERWTDLLCGKVIQRATSSLSSALKSIILTGSVARSEGTFLPRESGWQLTGDAEFILVFEEGTPLPLSATLSALQIQVEEELRGRGLECHLSLAAVHPHYLRELGPHIFAYELRNCGRLIWGDAVTLQLIPQFMATDLEGEDAWRLLCNRMIEALGAAAEPRAEVVSYRLTKLYLDIATSLLVFRGEYEPTYRGRATKLRSLAVSGPTDNVPFDLERFSLFVSACTEWKLKGVNLQGARHLLSYDGTVAGMWREAVEHARALWRWELCQMTSATTTQTDQELLRIWMRRQPASQRWRGWMHVVRKQGWVGSAKYWLSWARRAGAASPRSWIYAAGSELFFRLPELLSAEAHESNDWPQRAGSARWLPVSPSEIDGELKGWRAQAHAIEWNYKQFLEGTRS